MSEKLAEAIERTYKLLEDLCVQRANLLLDGKEVDRERIEIIDQSIHLMSDLLNLLQLQARTPDHEPIL